MNELMNDKKMRIALLAVLVLLALFLLAKTWDAAFGRGPNEPMNLITVTGTGEAVVIPDVAQVDFTVTEQGATVTEAQTKATEKANAALEYLKQQGIEDKDVKTTYYSVNPRYEYNNQSCAYGMPCPPVSSSPKIIGYEVSQSVQVKIRDTAKAGQVLEGLGSLNVQNISGPNFTVDDEDAVRAEAREAAIKEAREKAKVLAKQLGVRLGKTVSFYENEGPYPMYGYGKGGAMESDIRVSAVAPTLPTGQNETEVSVSITYEIH